MSEPATAALKFDNPHEEHERQLRELHLSIHAAINNILPRKVVALKQPYHPAYAAARIGELETMVGCLAGMLVKAGVLGEQDIVDMIGVVYAYDIMHLQLTASTVHTAKFLNDPPTPAAPARGEDPEAEEAGHDR